MVRTLRSVLAAFALTWLCLVPAFAQDVTLSVKQMRALAVERLQANDPQAAFAIATALLQRDPKDPTALMIRASAERTMGQTKAALASARAAWKAAKTQDHRFHAARVMAQVLSSSGKKTRAQLWLRRAVQLAPDQQGREVTIRDFTYVRRQNPWATELTFNVAPSSNINNGSSSATSQLFDLPFEFELQGSARALSGLEFSGGINSRYRLSRTRVAQQELLFRFNARTFQLSDEARRLAPTAKGSDFAYASFGLGYATTRVSRNGRNRYGLTAMFTHNRFAGKPLFNSSLVSLSHQYAISRRTQTHLSLGREVHTGFGQRANAGIWSARASLSHNFADSSRFGITLHGKRATSRDANLDYRQVGVDLNYALPPVLDAIDLTVGLSLSRKDHDRSPLTAAGRHEKTVALNVTAQFKKIEFYGFVPTMTLSASRTSANLDIYKRENFGVHMGIRSSF